MILEFTALAVLVLFLAAGFACIFFTTFGTLIMMAGIILYALMTGFAKVDVKTLVILGVLYGIGEAAEYLTTIFGVKKFGASNRAVVGAIIGGMLGAALGTLFFGIGLIPGTFIGIFLGAFFAELAVRRDVAGSVRAGAGGVIGRIGSILVKVVIAIAMIWIIAAKLI